MKRAIYMLFVVAFFSCSEKKLDGFGQAKLGMTINEFNQRFNTKFPLDKFFADTTYNDLVINEDITLKEVSLHFTNFKLTSISTDYSTDFHKYLERYGIKENNDSGVVFNTEDSIFCIAGKKRGKYVLIGILDKKNKEH